MYTMNTPMNPCHAVTGKVRFGFCALFTPTTSQIDTKANDPNKKLRYVARVLVPKSDTATKARLDKAIQAALERGKNTNRFREGTPLDRLPTPIYDGDGFRADGYTPFGPECKGMWVFTAACDAQRNKPAVVDVSNNPILDPTEVYAGMYGRVSIDFFPYNTGANQGIGCSLINVQKLADGEPLGAPRPTADQDFGDGYVDGTGQAFDPLS